MSMSSLSCRFLNGRTRSNSEIHITARWVEGWKFKDEKWKFEEEEFLPHIGDAKFRCRLHIYPLWGQGISRENIEKTLQTNRHAYTQGCVRVEFNCKDLVVTVPLNQAWEKTENESENPKIFRYFEGIELPVLPVQQVGLQVLVTYRNLDKLLRSEQLFVDEVDFFRWNPLKSS